jgi:pimeloyl-ACP methyl ester carboxylesterase
LLTTPVSRLILNDIGPAIEPSALARIGEYVSDPVDFASFDEAMAYIRTVSASFGEHTEEQWRHLTQYVVRQEGGRWRKHYDPGLAAPFARATPAAASAGEAILWRSFDGIACPTLIVRGGDSDLLSRETAQAMLARNRLARLVEVPGVGHAPSFLSDEQVDIAADFLLAE